MRDNILPALGFLAPGGDKAARRDDLANFMMAVGHGVWARRILDSRVDQRRLSSYVAELIDAELIDAELTRLIALPD